MPMLLYGNGMISGATSFPTAATFGSTLSVTGALTQSSSAAFSLASGQLAFPATQNASGDANTLDDYEEGTWTSTYNYSTVNTSGSTNGSTNVSGSYRKVGSLVYFTTATLNMSNITAGLFVLVNFSLPFVAAADACFSVSGYGLAGHYNGTMTAGGIQNPNVSSGSSLCYPRYTDWNGGSGWLAKTGNVGNATVFFTGCYITS